MADILSDLDVLNHRYSVQVAVHQAIGSTNSGKELMCSNIGQQHECETTNGRCQWTAGWTRFHTGTCQWSKPYTQQVLKELESYGRRYITMPKLFPATEDGFLALAKYEQLPTSLKSQLHMLPVDTPDNKRTVALQKMIIPEISGAAVGAMVKELVTKFQQKFPVDRYPWIESDLRTPTSTFYTSPNIDAGSKLAVYYLLLRLSEKNLFNTVQKYLAKELDPAQYVAQMYCILRDVKIPFYTKLEYLRRVTNEGFISRSIRQYTPTVYRAAKWSRGAAVLLLLVGGLYSAAGPGGPKSPGSGADFDAAVSQLLVSNGSNVQQSLYPGFTTQDAPLFQTVMNNQLRWHPKVAASDLMDQGAFVLMGATTAAAAALAIVVAARRHRKDPETPADAIESIAAAADYITHPDTGSQQQLLGKSQIFHGTMVAFGESHTSFRLPFQRYVDGTRFINRFRAMITLGNAIQDNRRYGMQTLVRVVRSEVEDYYKSDTLSIILDMVIDCYSGPPDAPSAAEAQLHELSILLAGIPSSSDLSTDQSTLHVLQTLINSRKRLTQQHLTDLHRIRDVLRKELAATVDSTLENHQLSSTVRGAGGIPARSSLYYSNIVICDHFQNWSQTGNYLAYGVDRWYVIHQHLVDSKVVPTASAYFLQEAVLFELLRSIALGQKIPQHYDEAVAVVVQTAYPARTTMLAEQDMVTLYNLVRQDTFTERLFHKLAPSTVPRAHDAVVAITQLIMEIPPANVTNYGLYHAQIIAGFQYFASQTS